VLTYWRLHGLMRHLHAAVRLQYPASLLSVSVGPFRLLARVLAASCTSLCLLLCTSSSLHHHSHLRVFSACRFFFTMVSQSLTNHGDCAGLCDIAGGRLAARSVMSCSSSVTTRAVELASYTICHSTNGLRLRQVMRRAQAGVLHPTHLFALVYSE
jgi:hypothetical protein